MPTVPAVTDAYAKVPDYRIASGNSDRAVEREIARDLLAVSRYLDGRLGRFFTKDAAVVARTFWTPNGRTGGDPDGENPWGQNGNAQAILFVDDMAVAPTVIRLDVDRDGVFTDETNLVAADYRLQPLNAMLGPEPEPYTSIELTPWGAWGSWPRGCMVEVTAQWGFPAVPSAIVSGTIELTRILRLESPRATQTVNMGLDQIEQTSREAREIVAGLVQHYRKFTL
jgi:hypothetical protein